VVRPEEAVRRGNCSRHRESNDTASKRNCRRKILSGIVDILAHRILARDTCDVLMEVWKWSTSANSDITLFFGQAALRHGMIMETRSR
jgi:hypothetical protein